MPTKLSIILFSETLLNIKKIAVHSQWGACMILKPENYYLHKEESNKSCLLTLRDIIMK